MLTTYLFDIPIYWCQQHKFDAEYDLKLAQHLSEFEKRSGIPLNDNLRMSLTDSFWRNYIAPWRFNQIVGYIRLYWLGSQLRGELWFMNAKRAGRQLTKKQFSLKDRAFELHVGPEQSCGEIFQCICQKLRAFEKNGQRRLFLDWEQFENIGRFVDWRSLMDSSTIGESSRGSGW